MRGSGGWWAGKPPARLAETLDGLAGVVRVAPEHGTLVLRGMQVAAPWRGRGIGKQLLQVVATWLGERQCYCVPYAHLTQFYGQIGFADEASVGVPEFLASRVDDYRKRGLDVRLMVRLLRAGLDGPVEPEYGRFRGLSGA